MKDNKSAGDDGFNSSYLIRTKAALVEPLKLLFEKSLEQGNSGFTRDQ